MKDFTSQQKEIVARKLGYDGPMQGFDEFIASSPALEAKYAAISGKFAERMARGGLVKLRKYAAGGAVPSQEEINTALQTELAARPGTSQADMAAYAKSAYGLTDEQINAAYAALPKTTTTAAADTTQAATTTAAVPTEKATTAATTTGTTTTTTAAPQAIPRTQTDVNTALTNLLKADPNASYANVLNAAKSYGITPDQVYAAYQTVAPTKLPTYTDAQVNSALTATLTNDKSLSSDPKIRYQQIVAAAKSYGIDPTRVLAAYQASSPNALPTYTPAEITAALNNLYKADPNATYANVVKAAAAYGITPAQVSAAYQATGRSTGTGTTTGTGTVTGTGTGTKTTVTSGTTGDTGSFTPGGGVDLTDAFGKPLGGQAASIKAAQIFDLPAQSIDTEARAGEATTIAGATPAATGQAAVPTATAAQTMTATQASTALADAFKNIGAAQGTAGTMEAAQQTEPTALAGAATEAQQIGAAQTVAAPAARTLGAGETVSGTAVDMARVGTELAKAQAAEGAVTEDMTVQGQLKKLTTNFDAANPPPWAAGALRAVTAEMSARGLGASSMAGSALVQAALEKALPIATADAAIYQQVASQNLSNRQQIAVLTAQQRATFLGQEFDQNFQTKVINAARIADIANLNFTANQQIALENSKMAQSVDLANLSSRQAAFMAELAQTATLETANLNNRQQAAVVNAQAALQMDLTNLSNEQQLTVIKTQQTTQAILSDAAADNAAKQFNATSTNQTNQFFAGLTTQVNQFNVSQSNAMEQFKVSEADAIAKFNADAQNQRDIFNAQQRLVIDQSNAQWQRDIATANTAAVNAANALNAQLAQQMTMAEYNNEVQMYRDDVTHAWQSSENDANRATTLAASEIAKAGQLAIAEATIAAGNASAIGSVAGKVIGNTSLSDIEKAWNWLTG